MAMCLWKRFSFIGSVISKTLMYSNIASSKVTCTLERSGWPSKKYSIRNFYQMEVPETYKCCSSVFPLHSFIFPSNHIKIEYETGNTSNQKFNEAKHFGVVLISILSVLGVKAFNSIPVLLADETNSEQNNSTEHVWNANEELDQDEASNETGGNVLLDSFEKDETFSQVFPEDLAITDPIEISDVHALKHSHVVREAAGVSAESALVLVIRASRALLAAIEDYRASLVHLLDLLSYNAELLSKLGQGAVYEEFLQRVTEAMVEAKASTDNSKKRVTDLQLVVRVSAQAVESLTLCCLLAGAEATALAARAAVTALQTQVEAAEAEVRRLQAEALARQTELIGMEDGSGRQQQEQAEERGQEEEDGRRQQEQADGGRQDEQEQGDGGRQDKEENEALDREEHPQESTEESEY